jgi:uncharacterized repeat protein (TIGR01451 family)
MLTATRSGHRAVGLRLTTATLIVGLATIAVAVVRVPVSGAAPGPVITCTSNENVFNTGFDAVTGGVLPNGSQDANWQVAGPFSTPKGSTPPTAVSPPPSGATFAAANVGNLAPASWSPTPFGNAQWISQQTLASPKQPNESGDWYYQYQFTLDPSVDPSKFSLDMNFMADNEVAEVYVNGVAQSSQTTGLPQSSTTHPYHFNGFQIANASATTLNHNWQTGTNTIVVQMKSSYPFEGFDAQIRPSAICPVALGVTKTAAPNPYVPGQLLTYTVTVTNGGPGTAQGVAISDPLPSALAGAGFTWTCSATTGSTCTASGAGNITDTVTIAVGGTLIYTVTGTVPAAASGTLTNTVTVTPPTGTNDPGCTPTCSATNIDPPAAAPTATVATTVESGGTGVTSVPTGASVTDNATVSGTGTVAPTGMVSFTFFSNSGCSGAGTPAGSGPLVAGAATSSSEGPLAAGSDSFLATYGGDTNYKTASGPCEAFTVINPTVSTSLTESANPSTVSSGTPVVFTYTEKNTGSAPITSVTVSGSSCGPATVVSSSDGNTTTLDPGATWILTCTETLTNTGKTTITVTDSAVGNGIANGVAAPTERASAKVKVTPATGCGLAVTISPNPLVETGQSEVHAVVQVEACPGFAGQAVTIESSQLQASCASLVFETLQGGSTTSPHTAGNIQVILDDDGNATLVLDGTDCAPGSSVVEASLTAAPFLTSLTTLQASPPAVTTAGVSGSPNPEVETGDTTASGDSDVYAVFYVETNPVYAEQSVTISSAQLEARCITGWRWEAGNGGSTVSGKGVNPGPFATTMLDNDGNAVFVFEGSSCAAGTSAVIADILAGTHPTYTTNYTILPPAVTPS